MNVLLTGASGKLGRAIQKSWANDTLLVPSRQELDLCSETSVFNYFSQNQISSVIHCAAKARLGACEVEPGEAINNNIIGTAHLVRCVLNEERKKNEQIRFIHVSSDGVYAGREGNYNENSPTIPHNVYGWSKLGAECSVRVLKNYCILRTRFFDESNIRYKESADDLYTSRLPLEQFVEILKKISDSSFVGVLNVGGERISDYECYKQYKPDLKACSRESIVQNLNFEIAKDASLDCSLLESLNLDEPRS